MSKNLVVMVAMVVSVVLTGCMYPETYDDQYYRERPPVRVVEPAEFDLETVEVTQLMEVQALDELEYYHQLVGEYKVYTSRGGFILERLILQLGADCGEEDSESSCMLFYDALDDFQVVLDGQICQTENLGFYQVSVTCQRLVTNLSTIEVYARVTEVVPEEIHGTIGVYQMSARMADGQSPIWNPSVGAHSGQTSVVLQAYQGWGINWQRTEVVILP